MRAQIQCVFTICARIRQRNALYIAHIVGLNAVLCDCNRIESTRLVFVETGALRCVSDLFLLRSLCANKAVQQNRWVYLTKTVCLQMTAK